MHKVLELYHDGGVMVEGYEYPLSAEQVILMQYIGMKDSDDVEIYEGDLWDDNGNIRVVCFSKFSESNQQTQCVVGGVTYLGYKFELGGYCANEVKIIGNVYEHPKLFRNKR